MLHSVWPKYLQQNIWNSSVLQGCKNDETEFTVLYKGTVPPFVINIFYK